MKPVRSLPQVIEMLPEILVQRARRVINAVGKGEDGKVARHRLKLVTDT